MPIKPVNDPPAARNLAQRILVPEAPGPRGGAALAAEAVAPEVGALPVFNLSLPSLLKQDFDQAVATAWRYVSLVPHSGRGGIVELHDQGEGEATVAHHAEGGMAARVAEAGNRAAADVEREDTDFEARILRLPQIHMEALWLHSPTQGIRDRFYGLPTSQRDLVDQEFVSTAIARATDYLGRLETASGGEAFAVQAPSAEASDGEDEGGVPT